MNFFRNSEMFNFWNSKLFLKLKSWIFLNFLISWIIQIHFDFKFKKSFKFEFWILQIWKFRILKKIDVENQNSKFEKKL